MKIFGIKNHSLFIRSAVLACAVGAMTGSCVKQGVLTDTTEAKERLESELPPVTLFNHFARDIGLLQKGYGIEGVPAVRCEDSKHRQIYSVYDKSLNQKSADTLWLRQLMYNGNDLLSADTFKFYKYENGLMVENVRKTINNTTLKRVNSETWEERSQTRTYDWFKLSENSFARESVNYGDRYYNPEIAHLPE